MRDIGFKLIWNFADHLSKNYFFKYLFNSVVELRFDVKKYKVCVKFSNRVILRCL